MSAQSTGKIEELESIRGIAAMLVVLFHVPDWNRSLTDIRLIHNSYYMVDLFFVLSGFVMNLNYGDRLRGVRDVARFQFLRLGRLYPVHLLFLLLAVLSSASGWFAATAFGLHVPNGSPLKDATLASFTEQLLLIHSLGFFHIAHPFNLPSWSISVEFYTYLIFGVVCLISQYALRFSAFVALSGAALALLCFGGDSTANFSDMLQCLAGYFLGCLVARSASHPGVLPRGSTFAALAAMALFLSVRRAPQFDVLIFFLSAALIVAVVCSKDDFVKAMLRGRLLKFLGLISYSIYMSHTFVLWVCNQFVRVVLRRPESIADGISTPQLSPWAACLGIAFALAATVVLSALVFKYLEDPLRLKSKEFARRHLAPRRGAPITAV